jgi:hypothetical protein
MANQTMTSTAPVVKSGVVHYQLKGKDYVRSAPNLFKTLNFENARGYQLTQAYLISKTIRQHLRAVIPNPSCVDMQDRLRANVLEYIQRCCKDPDAWIDCAWMINKIDFTDHGICENRTWVSKVKVKRKSSRRTEIKIPSFVPSRSLHVPWHTHTVVCKIAMSVCYRKTGASVDNILTEFSFPYNNTKVPLLTIPLELKTPKMSIVVTGLCLHFKRTHHYALYKDEAGKYFQSAIIHSMGV